MSDWGNEDAQKKQTNKNKQTKKPQVQIHTGQPGNLRGVQLAPAKCYHSFFIPVLPLQSFSSLNSLLTAEAIGYVNVDKANIITGEEIYKINAQM